MIRFIVCFFLTTSIAFANHNLKQAFDDFNFAVTVEGQSVEAAQNGLAAAIAHSGLSPKEVLNLALIDVQDARLVGDINAVSEMNLSDVDFLIAAENAVRASQSKGASWSEVKAGPALLILSVVIGVCLVVSMGLQR